MALYRRKKQDNKDSVDLGFGSSIIKGAKRLINKDGSFNIHKEGVGLNIYQRLVTISWRAYFGIITLIFIGINALFAIGFTLIGIEHLSVEPVNHFLIDFSHAFFFSVQTFTTVGYGSVSPDPDAFATNILASFCALTGLLCGAMATGLSFSRFSSPALQLKFSKQAIIAPYKDDWSFQVRLVHMRNDDLYNLHARITMTWLVDVLETGKQRRMFKLLPLEIDRIHLFPLNWTLTHPIDKESPFYEKTKEDMERAKPEFLVMISGYDETFGKPFFERTSYNWDELEWHVQFERMYYTDAKSGKTFLDIDKINNTQTLK